MTGVAVSMDPPPHAPAGIRHGAAGGGGDDGGEAGLIKCAMVSESEEILFKDYSDSTRRPRFLQPTSYSGPWFTRISKKALFLGQVVLFGVVLVQFVMLYRNYAVAAAAVAADLVDAGVVRRQSASAASASTSGLPDYYQTDPLLLPGWSLKLFD